MMRAFKIILLRTLQKFTAHHAAKRAYGRNRCRPEAVKDGAVDVSDAKPLCDACTRLLLVGVKGGA